MANKNEETPPIAALMIVIIAGVCAYFIYEFGGPTWHWITNTLLLG